MTPGLFVQHTLRESRGGLSRLIFFVLCLAIGVAAVVTIAGLSSSLETGFRSGAKEMLGADIVARADQPFPDGLTAEISTIPMAEWMITRDQAQIVQTGEGDSLRTQLSELLVVEPAYPFYGDLELQPAGSLDTVLSADSVVIASELASQLDIAAGDSVRLGTETYQVAAVAHNEPDRITGFMYIGPRVYLSQEAFARSGLADVGTRVRYKALIKLPDMPTDELAALKNKLEDVVENEARVRFETYTEGRPSLQRGLDTLGRFLGLIALLSLLLGGVGVAQAVRAWIASRVTAIAVLKCVGMRPREILALYAAQAALLGVVGSAFGATIAVLLMAAMPIALASYIPAELINPWQPLAILRGFALGLAVAMVFSLPALVAVLRVPPILVFRREAEPLYQARWAPILTAILMIIGIGSLAALQARSMLVGVLFTGGVLSTMLVLSIGAYVVMRIVSKLPRDRISRVWVRHGLAAVARPGANTIPSVVALGLGLLVLTCAGIVQRHVAGQLTNTLPEIAPSALMVNIMPQQTEKVRQILEDEGAEQIISNPLIITRLATLNGDQMSELVVEEQDNAPDDRDRRLSRRHALRDHWITYLDETPVGNNITDGTWWSDPDVAEVSLEKGWAERYDLELGSTMSFMADGGETEFKVTSLREMEWEEIGINFDIIVEPGYFEDVAQLGVATMQLKEGTSGRVQNAVVSAYPNITFIRLDDVVDRISSQLNRIGWGVRMLGLFIVGAAVAVLAGTIGIDSSRRGREVALLKTIGMTRREVAGVFAAEYALIGLVSAIIGIGGGTIVSWQMITRAFESEFEWPFAFIAVAVVGGIAVSVFAGFVASQGALRQRPIEVLRQQE